MRESPTDDAEQEELLLEKAKDALAEAFGTYLNGFDDGEKVRLKADFKTAVNSSRNIAELTVAASFFCMAEGLDFDPLSVLRAQSIWENETEQGPLATGPVASDQAPEELTREQKERMAILMQYRHFVTKEFIQERLTIHFIGEGSLELLIYQGVVWALAEPHIERIFGILLRRHEEQSRGGPIPKKKRKELTVEAEEKAMLLAKALLESNGIREPA